MSLKTADVASKLPKIKPLYIVIVVLLLITAFSLFQFYRAQQELKNFKANPEENAGREVQKLVDEVAKILDLPKNETPTIATVTDPEKLKDQAFFVNAKEGDKVLIYNNSKKAVLYRPSEKKVLNFAPINIGSEQLKQSDSQNAENYKFMVLNGTAVAGLAGRYQDKIKDQVKNAEIVSISNAEDNNVEKTFIVDTNGNKSEKLNEIAGLLEIVSGTLPTDQLNKDVDFIIVVGIDKAGI